MGVRLLGAVRLPSRSIDGIKLGGLSDLAWDEQTELLYAVGDGGQLFHLRPLFSEGMLSDVEIVAAFSLRDRRNRPLRSPWADAEGLSVIHNGTSFDLLISFEAKPRIERYSREGIWLGAESLPPVLTNIRYYANPNKALEAVAVHPRWGVVVGTEHTPRKGRNKFTFIHSLSEKYWSYPLYKAPNSALVAMEVLPDGSLLTLERAFVTLTQPLIISLRLTHLSENTFRPLQVYTVAAFDTSQGWLLDNFEGLTRYRDHRFFMISDDNHSILQSTLLVYFELLPKTVSN